jgi:hypothetical protein
MTPACGRRKKNFWGGLGKIQIVVLDFSYTVCEFLEKCSEISKNPTTEIPLHKIENNYS